jgi:hypothetical protein
MKVGGQRHAQAALPQERAVTHCIGGWVGPRAGLDGCGKSRSPDRPARSEPLYRLRYPRPRLHGVYCRWKNLLFPVLSPSPLPSTKHLSFWERRLTFSPPARVAALKHTISPSHWQAEVTIRSNKLHHGKRHCPLPVLLVSFRAPLLEDL